MNSHSTAWALSAILLFISVVITVNLHGNNNRVFSSGKTTHIIDSPEQAYTLWHDKQVKGRILLLFDNYPHAIGYNNYQGKPKLTPSNFVEFSIFANIIRRLYYIVPDDKWLEFKQQEAMYRPLRNVPGIPKSLYLFTFSGIPIIAVTPTSLPHIAEVPLVYINCSLFNYKQTIELLVQKNISSDVLVAYQQGVIYEKK